jgi:hypothetical protein
MSSITVWGNLKKAGLCTCHKKLILNIHCFAAGKQHQAAIKKATATCRGANLLYNLQVYKGSRTPRPRPAIRLMTNNTRKM